MSDSREGQTLKVGPRRSVLAVILARGGSKGIPRKNLRHVGGKTLLQRSIEACHSASTVDDVVVSTDDQEIACEAERHRAQVVERPEDLAGDLVSSESALKHAIEEWCRQSGHDYRAVALIQATSPFTTATDIDRTMSPILEGNADSTLSVVDDFGYFWFPEEGRGWGMRYQMRARRQDRGPWKRESGNLYGMRLKAFLETENLFTGVVQPVTIPERNSLEIDEPLELFVADRICEYLIEEENS